MKTYIEEVNDELEKIGMPGLCSIIINEGRISLLDFAVILGAQIFQAKVAGLSVEIAAKTIYEALYNVYVEKVSQESEVKQ